MLLKPVSKLAGRKAVGIPLQQHGFGIRVPTDAKFDHADRFWALSGECQGVRVHNVSVRAISQ
jgi:hypothetical protein